METSDRIVIGLDQGTTNTKAVAVNNAGRIVAEATRPIATVSPQPGWVEQDAAAMLGNSVACVREVLRHVNCDAAGVAGIGIANQTETLVVWDRKTGEPLLPAIVWQCRRGHAEIEAINNGRNKAVIRQRTGLDLDPTFTLPKLKWIFENRPEIAKGLRSGAYLFGTVDCWLIWKLSGGAVYATEPSNASRTMAFDINTLRWDSQLLDLFDLSLGELPEIRRSSGSFGHTAKDYLGIAVPLTAALGDQQASLFGHGCFEVNEMKVTYGTGAFLWINAGHRAELPQVEGLVRTVAWQLDEPCYALEGFIMSAGASLDWLATHFGVPSGGSGVVEEAERLGDSDGVVLVPAFQGLASPWWRPDVRAGLIGMTGATTLGHICHASLEALCYQVRTILERISQTLDLKVGRVNADGGLTRSSYLMQLQADILQRPVAPSRYQSVTPYGSALMAGLGAGLWDDLDHLRRIIPAPATVVPDPALTERWNRSFADWCAAVDALLRLYRSHNTTA